MATARRRFFLAAQWIFATVVVWSAYRALDGQWKVAAERLATIHVAWAWVAAATVIVFLTYLLLIETWRQVIIASGETLSFPVAARIWFISNLGKYVPGKVWSIAAMTVMARDQAVSPVMAAGSSVLVQLLSVATGVAVVFAAGSRAIQNQWLAVGLLAIVAAFVAAVPRLLPFASRAAASMTGKKVELPMIAAKTVWLAAVRSVISWIAYGVAFQFFVRGVLGSSAGATSSYIAVYAASYIIGFLALFAPGGAVVRESALVTGMVRLGLSGQPDALAVAIASRLWLTAVEILPGIASLAIKKPAPRTLQ